jgi:hypothetical protein
MLANHEKNPQCLGPWNLPEPFCNHGNHNVSPSNLPETDGNCKIYLTLN